MRFLVIALLAINFLVIAGMQPLYAQSCNCKEYLYINEPAENATLKFEIQSNGSLVEVTHVNGAHWQQGVTVDPHGIGFDEHGFVYVGNRVNTMRGVDKMTCDGAVVELDYLPPNNTGTMGSPGNQTNIQIVNNTMYINNWHGSAYPQSPLVFAYDLCTKAFLGEYTVCGISGTYSWEFIIDEPNNKILIHSAGAVACGPLDASLNGACVPVIINDGYQYGGMSYDGAGNIFIRDVASDALKKYDTNGTLLCNVNTNTFPGGSDGYGIIYSPSTGYLYLGASDQDCISVIDPTNCSYVMQGAPNPGGTASKALAITTECCPTNPNTVIDTTFCNLMIGDQLFISDLTNCAGNICSNTWQAAMGNSGLT